MTEQITSQREFRQEHPVLYWLTVFPVVTLAFLGMSAGVVCAPFISGFIAGKKVMRSAWDLNELENEP